MQLDPIGLATIILVLRETFGTQFEEYARRVPVFIPQLWR
jgi:hypothetical protein